MALVWRRGAIHKSRGRPASNTFNVGVRDYVLELVRQNYRDFGPTLASEALLERHGVEVSRETLRKWMTEAGLWLSRRQRRTFHQSRLRRESYGELVQIGGSQHRWFEDRAETCTLLVLIDDATSRIMQLRFVPSESTYSYFEALQAIWRATAAPLRSTPTSTPFPHEPRRRWWSGHDPVRTCVGGAKHRDPLRELQPGEGPHRACQPHTLATKPRALAREGTVGTQARHERADQQRKGGYRKRPRSVYGPDFIENALASKAVEMPARWKARKT